MKKFMVVLLVCFATLMISSVAFAFSLKTVTSWFGLQTVSYILTGILSLGAITGGVLFTKIVRTLNEVGEFIVWLATALADKKLTQEELKEGLSQAKDVFNVFAKTPENFTVE